MTRAQLNAIREAVRFALSIAEASPNTAAAFGIGTKERTAIQSLAPFLDAEQQRVDAAGERHEWHTLNREAKKKLYKYANDCEI